MRKVRAIVFDRFGPPEEVARSEEIDLPALGADEALVELVAAPINPADLNLIEGKYAIRPPLPAVAGVEGAALVREVGAAVRDLAAGDMVLLPPGDGTWREAAVVKASRLVTVSTGISPQQAAMLRVNPATALRMLRDFVKLKRREWVVQNAANSGVGRAVIEIARECGWQTVNIVRRAELVEELRALGADVVLLETPTVSDDIATATGGAEIRLGLNAVGGESAVRLANSLARGGMLVTYGAMSRQPLRIPNGLLIFRDLHCRGFWVSRWYELATAEARAEMFAELFEWAKRGHFHAPVERTYGLEEVAAALAHAAQSGRAGKILFQPKAGAGLAEQRP